MKDIVNENIMTTYNKTEIPQTPLIELKNETEDIPDEVLHNLTSKVEKKEVSIQEKKSDCISLKKLIRLLFIIFMAINNSFPFVNAIIEIILRAIFDFDFNGFLVAEIVFYLLIVVCLIKAACWNDTGDCEVGLGCVSLICLVITFNMEIFPYFGEPHSGREYSDEFMNSYIKFRIIGILIVIANDIIFSIIGYNAYYKCGFYYLH